MKNYKKNELVIIKDSDGKIIIGQLKSIKLGIVELKNMKETFDIKYLYECTDERLKKIGVNGEKKDLLEPDVKKNLPLVAIPKN